MSIPLSILQRHLAFGSGEDDEEDSDEMFEDENRDNQDLFDDFDPQYYRRHHMNIPHGLFHLVSYLRSDPI